MEIWPVTCAGLCVRDREGSYLREVFRVGTGKCWENHGLAKAQTEALLEGTINHIDRCGSGKSLRVT